MKCRIAIVSVAGIACGVAATTAMAQPSVLIAAAANASSTNCRYLDVQSKLVGTGVFTTVDVHNMSTSASGSLPTLAQLLNYDVVLTWSNTQWNTSGDAAGDLFADYMDAGGAVVVGVFANASIPLGGRWVTGGYEVIIAGSGQTQGAAQLGTVHDPSHPIMAGVNTFHGGSSSYRPTSTVLAAGATAIADWDDGRILVAVGNVPGRVDLAMYPPSSDCRTDFWESNTDGALLMANALVFAAGGGAQPCYADCNGDGTLNINDFLCFIDEFAQAQTLPASQQETHYANCTGATSEPILNINDFLCFIDEFAQGCP